MRKRQICVTIDNKLYKELEREKEKTGMPISKQVELRLMGYRIVKE